MISLVYAMFVALEPGAVFLRDDMVRQLDSSRFHRRVLDCIQNEEIVLCIIVLCMIRRRAEEVGNELLAAVISGGAAFLGALVAVVGLWSTTKRTLYVTREQRRFDLAREKSGAILPDMYTQLLDLLSEYGSFVDHPIELRDEEGNISQQMAAENVAAIERKRKQLQDRVTELFDYHKRHSIWLPTALATMIDQLLRELIEHAQRYAESTKRNLSYATNMVRAKVASRRMQEERSKVERVEARFETLKAELSELGIEVDAREPTADEAPEIEAIKAEVRAWKDRARDLGIEIDAASTDVDEPSDAQQLESEEEVKEQPLADMFFDTFTLYQGVAKGSFKLWLTSARVWDLPRIREYSRKVLGVDEISVDGL
jgi:hypothetical protein